MHSARPTRWAGRGGCAFGAEELPVLKRRLGASGPDVNALLLGSWPTHEAVGADEGLAVLGAARRGGLTVLDDARYP